MNTRWPLLVATLLVLITPQASTAQVPADLRAATRARNDAVAKADAATWDKLTMDNFTVVFPWGTFTKAERSAQIKQQKASTAPPLAHEQFQPAGNAYLHRYEIQGGSLLEVWVKDRGAWRVATVQGSVLDPDSATLRHAIDSADARFVAAFKRGDVAALAADYTDDAVLMSPGISAWQGRAAITQGYTAFLAQFSTTDARLTTTDVIRAGYYAIERGTYSWTLHPKTGSGPDIIDTGKYLTVWERQDDGSWKMIRDMSNSDKPSM